MNTRQTWCFLWISILVLCWEEHDLLMHGRLRCYWRCLLHTNSPCVLLHKKTALVWKGMRENRQCWPNNACFLWHVLWASLSWFCLFLSLPNDPCAVSLSSCIHQWFLIYIMYCIQCRIKWKPSGNEHEYFSWLWLGGLWVDRKNVYLRD